MQPRKKMLRSTVIVLIFLGLSKLTGFGKLILMTEQFGLSNEADALAAAIQVPDLFMKMVSGGALAAALIPVYSNYLNKSQKDEQNELASTVVTLVALILGVICVLIGIFAPWITRAILVPHFSAENQHLVAQLMRIVIFSILIVGVNAVISALLYTHQHFILPAVADVVIDLGQIAGLILLAPRYGVFGVAWGGVIGAVLQFFVQLPALYWLGIVIRPKINLHLQGVREVLRLMGPRLVTIGGTQLSDIIVIRSASQLPEGSVSAYYYALLLIGIPVSLFGWAIGTVIFPTMAEQFNRDDQTTLRKTATSGILILSGLMFPAAAGLVALGRQGIQFIFERGSFDSSATATMYTIVVILSVRILADSGLVIIERVFYAKHDTKTVMWFSLLWFFLYIVAALILIPTIGVVGLALAHSGSFLITTGAMYYWLQRGAAFFDQSLLSSGLLRIVVACLLLTIPIIILQRMGLSPSLYVVSAIPLGVLSYLLFFVLFFHKQFPYWRKLVVEQ